MSCISGETSGSRPNDLSWNYLLGLIGEQLILPPSEAGVPLLVFLVPAITPFIPIFKVVPSKACSQHW
ncbi:hypothetical protein AV530_013697 [Patagioenas fasciata monilis]|uniref:Uncharacterized protein n=1 Tax=Patagioenas fasciata monilis TaxID=372326 RepID=A0A1V4J840_PATFA|nr:hypothetical protein AV530_013697 [Patagioenas fasciata monilis]